MSKLNLESRMDFNRSVGTEDRFALRSWIEKLIEVLNQSNPTIWEEMLAPEFTVEGLLDRPLSRSAFVEFLKTEFDRGMFALRFPDLKIHWAGAYFTASGTYESFTDGVLSFQGEVELRIIKDEETFALVEEKLYPRFRVQR